MDGITQQLAAARHAMPQRNALRRVLRDAFVP
jgi:hypothetical protein